MMYIGIDLGGINTAAGLVSDSGEISSKRSVPTPRTPEAVADAIAEHVKNLLELSDGSVKYIGVGSPGAIDPGNGVIEYWANLGFNNVPLGRMIEERTGLPVIIENDAACAALGEFRSGAGKGVSSLLAVTLGTGVGGGAVLDGKLYTGINHASLEIGHLVIEHNGRPCTCGRKGCFEAYCSATALIKEARKAMDLCPDSLLWKLAGSKENVNGKVVFDAFEAEDPAAVKVVEEYISYLGCGITNLVNVFQPDVVCIGGGVSGAGETLLSPVRRILDSEDYARGCKKRARLVQAELGNDAGIIGAALLGVN
ncbi:MAG: ROK family protein [Clostridiales bacterium]|nr:ROK family protein [Clostridiales bacterium]